MKKAEKAWATERKSYPMASYVAGYERGALEERVRLADMIEANLDTLRTFAPMKTPELIAHLVRTLRD